MLKESLADFKHRNLKLFTSITKERKLLRIFSFFQLRKNSNGVLAKNYLHAVQHYQWAIGND